MSKEHPITPPPELVEEWASDSPIQANDENWAYELYIAHQAARWGADQELEACCEWLGREVNSGWGLGTQLRAARRPRPLSLRELALASVKRLEKSGELFSDQMRELEFIRKALEQFND